MIKTAKQWIYNFNAQSRYKDKFIEVIVDLMKKK